MKRKEQIKYIIDEMDFKRIRSVMQHLNWKWKYENDEEMIPSLDDLKSIAEHCLNKVAYSPDESSICFAGGFEAEKINNTLELRFIIDRINPLAHLLDNDISAQKELTERK